MPGITKVKLEQREAEKGPGMQTAGRNPPEGRDGAGVPYGGTLACKCKSFWCLKKMSRQPF